VSGEDYIIRSFMLCTPHQISLGDQVKRTEIGTTCSTYVGKNTCRQGFSRET
jgi:hypothetical protein